MSRIANVVYLSALGDAWGNDTEFLKFKEIPVEVPLPNPLIITDDTQMSLAVVNGLREAEISDNDRLESIALCFLDWRHDEDNDRAPGNTCIAALNSLERSMGGGTERPFDPFVGTITTSKGCGANMRAPWLGLMPWRAREVTNVAFDQAMITHGHPTALEAASLTALGVWALVHGVVKPTHLTEYLMNKAAPTGECYQALAKALRTPAEQVMNPNLDPCVPIGQGWIAEEALALSARIADLYAANVREGIHRAVRTGGDSDSIACITGAFLGAGLPDSTDWSALFSEEIAFEPRYETELDQAVRFIRRAVQKDLLDLMS